MTRRAPRRYGIIVDQRAEGASPAGWRWLCDTNKRSLPILRYTEADAVARCATLNAAIELDAAAGRHNCATAYTVARIPAGVRSALDGAAGRRAS